MQKINLQENKLVVWIIGTNGSSKTTQARMLHEYFRNIAGDIIRPLLFEYDKNGCGSGSNSSQTYFYFTKMGSLSSNLGNLKGNACSGTDNLGKKEQVILAFKKALQHTPVVVLEGIMATGQYIEFLKTDETIVYLVHLTLTEDALFDRLKHRRATKTGLGIESVIIAPKTRENMLGKLKGFKSLFERMKSRVDLSREIDSTKLTKEQIHKIIVMDVEKLIQR